LFEASLGRAQAPGEVVTWARVSVDLVTGSRRREPLSTAGVSNESSR
jgi:hypothetical protein